MKKIIIANWKMHGEKSWIERIDTLIKQAEHLPSTLIVCPPFPYIKTFAEQAENSTLMLGAQSCHEAPAGAFTGEVSAPMLADIGVSHVILGHSERRSYYLETNATVKLKAKAVLEAGMTPIVCVGEPQEVREAGKAVDYIIKQVDEALSGINVADCILAYEPIWAIGSGLTPTHDDIHEVHQAIGHQLKTLQAGSNNKIPILYGGSVKPENASSILHVDGVDGALVGGASLAANDLLAIAKACPA